MLLDGKYISGSADGIKDGRVTREKIKKTELVYSTDAMDSCFVPYYRFYVELDHSPVPGLKCYGEFDVPAIKESISPNKQIFSGLSSGQLCFL